jgi:hypothetical protein
MGGFHFFILFADFPARASLPPLFPLPNQPFGSGFSGVV